MNTETLRVPITEKGITKALFDARLAPLVQTAVTEREVKQSATVGGVCYQLIIRLTRWTGRTKPEQIATLSELFFEVYPKMYQRFGVAGHSPTKITLDIENKGYGIAWCAESLLHLHDGWLEKCPEDYDCITHELAHAIQNGWDGAYLEYDSYVERFADACRYLYAFGDGKYNDKHWRLQTVLGEPTRADSVRFLVYLDYFYSTKENDLLLNYFKVCRDGAYAAEHWAKAWAKIFEGSALEGREIDEVFSEYASSGFALLDSGKKEGVSPLLAAFDLRRYTR